MNNVVPMFGPQDSDFASYMAQSETQAKVLPASAWREGLIESTRPQEDTLGAKLPWAKTHDMIRLRPGEVSCWLGINGHGKSQLLGQISMSLAAQDEPVCLASFEMKPLVTLKRMLRQAARNATPSEAMAGRLIDWLDGRYWFYDQQGTVTPHQVFKVIQYAAERLKCRHVIVDSLMKCVRGEEDRDGQKEFVDTVTALARDLGIHVHLVHHVRKSDDESKMPGKFDARGSAAITDLVDNVFVVWRNKPKERAIERQIRSGTAADPKELAKPDTILLCEKQRNGEWEGSVGLWFHPGSLQYTPDSRNLPMDLLITQGDRPHSAH